MWEAVEMLKDKNSLPAICGRVCPQETQCEELCVLGRKGEPVAIGRLERFVADWEREQGMRVPRRCRRQRASAWPSSAPARRASPPPATWPRWATRSRSSRRCTRPAAC